MANNENGPDDIGEINSFIENQGLDAQESQSGSLSAVEEEKKQS